MLSRHRAHWLAVLLIVSVSLASGYYSFFIHPPAVLTDDDGAARWEQRMQSVREALPDTVVEVGYVSDPEDVAYVQEFSLTRYALAPVRVKQGVEFEWIIGNFTDTEPEAILDPQISSSYIIEEFGAGIFLIHRTTP